MRVRHVLAAVFLRTSMPANVRLSPDSDRSAGRLDDASMMLNDFGIDELFLKHLRSASAPSSSAPTKRL